MTRIVELLRGSRSRKPYWRAVSRACPGVWRVSGLVEAALTRLAKALIDRGYLCVEGGDYPTLDVTTRGQGCWKASAPWS